MNLKLIGCIFLVTGTSIGAGLLALPVATAAGGFYSTSAILFLCWLTMTAAAFCVLEVNLRLHANNNIISMAKHTLGRTASMFMWVVYLLLLYSLLAAYISGGTDITHTVFLFSHIKDKNWINTLLFTFILSILVFSGTRNVDWANRLIMTSKLAIFVFLAFLIVPHTSEHLLAQGHPSSIFSAIMVVVTSFGFAIIIPSLSNYLHRDAKQLRLVVAMGSLISLLFYWIWCLAIQGNISTLGTDGLINLSHSNHVISGLTIALHHRLNSSFISIGMSLFVSISILTSFLGVALSLSDFLADGFGLEKKGNGKYIIYAATFIPPVAMVLYSPGLFITALKYAGIFCVILLILLPAAMAWKIRQQPAKQFAYQVFGGKYTLGLILLVGVILLGIGVETIA